MVVCSKLVKGNIPHDGHFQDTKNNAMQGEH